MTKKYIAEQALIDINAGSINMDNKVKPQAVRAKAGQIMDRVMFDHLIALNKLRKAPGFYSPREVLSRDTLALTDNAGTFTGHALNLPLRKTIYEVEIAGVSSGACATVGDVLIPIAIPKGMFKRLEGSDLGEFYSYHISHGSDTGVDLEVDTGTDNATVSSVYVHYIKSAAKAGDTDELKIPDDLGALMIQAIVQSFAPTKQGNQDYKQDNAE